MIAWTLVGVFLATTALLAAFCWRLMQDQLRANTLIDDTMKQLRADRDTMLATALDARGVILRDPSQPPRTVEAVNVASLRRRVEGNLSRLERESAAKAIDRDARVAQEMDEANRIARAGRVSRGDDA